MTSHRSSKLIPGTVIDNNAYSEQIYGLIMHSRVQELSDLLSKHGSQLNVIEMRDARNFTVIAFAAYKNYEECFMLLFNHALDKNLADSSVTFKRK